MLAVDAVPRGEIRVVHHFAPKDVAVFQRGDFGLVQLRQFNAVELGNGFHVRCKPAHAEFFFEQRIDTVQRAARPAAGDDQAIAVHAQHKTIGAEFGEINFRAQLGQVRVVAQQDFARAGLFRIRHDGEFRAGHFFEVPLQFLGGVTLGRNRAGRNDNAVLALALVGEGHVGLGVEDPAQPEAAHRQPGRPVPR